MVLLSGCWRQLHIQSAADTTTTSCQQRIAQYLVEVVHANIRRRVIHVKLIGVPTLFFERRLGSFDWRGLLIDDRVVKHV